MRSAKHRGQRVKSGNRINRMAERCEDLGGEFKCMRCGRRRNKDKPPGACHGFTWMGEEFGVSLKTWNHRYDGGHDLQRIVDMHGRILVCCQKCSGYRRAKIRGGKQKDKYVEKDS